MTIYNGEVITASDLNTLFDGYHTSLEADIETDPGDVRISWYSETTDDVSLSWVAGDDYQVIAFGCDGYHVSSSVISNSFVGLGVDFSYSATVSGGDWKYREAAGDSIRIYKGADYTITLSTSLNGNNNIWALVRLRKRKI